MPADINGVAFFFKQWGTWGSDGVKRNKKANGKLINGHPDLHSGAFAPTDFIRFFIPATKESLVNC